MNEHIVTSFNDVMDELSGELVHMGQLVRKQLKGALKEGHTVDPRTYDAVLALDFGEASLAVNEGVNVGLRDQFKDGFEDLFTTPSARDPIVNDGDLLCAQGVDGELRAQPRLQVIRGDGAVEVGVVAAVWNDQLEW